MKKIYCFINGGSAGWYDVCALAEDGHCLAGHISSEKYWAMHDIGITSDWKHDKYKEHYPEGFELVWLDKPLEDDGFKSALELNEKLGQEAELKDKPGVEITYA